MSFVCIVFPLFPFFFLLFSFLLREGGAVVVWFCSHGICILFQSLLCRGLAPRVLRLVLSAVGTRNEYALFYEKDADVERCFVVCWLDNALQKICIGQEVLDQPMPKSELVPLAQFVHSVQNARLPFCVSGASPVLLRVIEDNRTDGKRLVMHQQFSEEVFLQCVRQAHQDVFGMVEVTSLVDYVILRLKSAVYEDWTDGKVLLRKAIRQGFVAFQDLREVLTDLVDLWPSIRLFIRCTGLPHVKDQADSVSLLHDFFFREVLHGRLVGHLLFSVCLVILCCCLVERYGFNCDLRRTGAVSFWAVAIDVGYFPYSFAEVETEPQRLCIPWLW